MRATIGSAPGRKHESDVRPVEVLPPVTRERVNSGAPRVRRWRISRGLRKVSRERRRGDVDRTVVDVGLIGGGGESHVDGVHVGARE
jgi:hypothetical protein